MSIISLVIAPTLARIHQVKIEKNRNLKMENLIMLQNETNLENNKTPKNVWTLQTRNPDNLKVAEPNVKKMIDEMEGDNLINNSTYSVEVANSWLYINGVKQSEEINNRYKKHYAGTGDFITGEERK